MRNKNKGYLGSLVNMTPLEFYKGKFEGADADDKALIEAYGGIFKTPPYLIEVRPILRIDGMRAAEGSVMSAGTGTCFSITYTRPGGKTEVFDHHITTGSFNAVGITTGRVRPEFLALLDGKNLIDL